MVACCTELKSGPVRGTSSHLFKGVMVGGFQTRTGFKDFHMDANESDLAVSKDAVSANAQEAFSRLRAMTAPDQQTWDLSPRDVEAIRWAIAEIASLRLAFNFKEAPAQINAIDHR